MRYMAEIIGKYLDWRSVILNIKFLYVNCYTDWNYHVLTCKKRLSSKVGIKETYREMRTKTHDFYICIYYFALCHTN
jgi:hypothetical protein